MKWTTLHIIDNKMTEIQKIEAITKDILAGYYGTTQKCGTETQKWQYAHNQARKIFEGELIIDPLHTPHV
jgi:hypothetical protein